MNEYKYEISPEQDIKEYIKVGNDYIFNREIKKSKNKNNSTPKPIANSYEEFESWLNGVLTDNEFPKNGGIYFLLFGPNEEGFGISVEVCNSFDKEEDDWASDYIYSSKMHMIATNGECDDESALKYATSMVKKYMRAGEERKTLKSYMGIGIGFSDGDIVYP